MIIAHKRENWYRLVKDGGDWYWQSLSNESDYWGDFSSKKEAIEFAKSRGFSIS